MLLRREAFDGIHGALSNFGLRRPMALLITRLGSHQARCRIPGFREGMPAIP